MEKFILLRIENRNENDNWIEDIYIPIKLEEVVYIHTYTPTFSRTYDPNVIENSKYIVSKPSFLHQQMVEYYNENQ